MGYAKVGGAYTYGVCCVMYTVRYMQVCVWDHECVFVYMYVFVMLGKATSQTVPCIRRNINNV